MPAITGEEGVALLRDTLNAYELRIEFSTALSVNGAHPCADFYTKDYAGTNRWKRVNLPLMLPPEGGTRADLLRQFADMLDLLSEGETVRALRVLRHPLNGGNE